MSEAPARHDSVSVILHWSVGIAIILLAATELLRGEVFPKGSYVHEVLKALHNPAGTVVFGLILLRLLWRSTHPAPAMPTSMRPWESFAARLVHYALYFMMIVLPLTGIMYVLARGRSINFSLFEISYPLNHIFSRDTAHTLKNAHEFLGQAVLVLAFAHAVAALWHHYVRRDNVLLRMLPTRRA